MLKVRVASFRRAAHMIDAHGGVVTVGTLARVMTCTQEYVASILTSLPWLRHELGVTLSVRDSSSVYIKAARDLAQKGEYVTSVTLAEQMHLDRDSVHAYLKRHPEVASQLGLVPHAFEVRKRVVARYRIRTLLLSTTSDRKVRPSVYAKHYGVDRSFVYRDIKKYPEIEQYFYTPRKVEKSTVSL